MPLGAGRRLGPYQILSLLGSGGMGEVYRARDTRLDRDVALKVLPAEHAKDPERRRRFEREARVLAALDHPHVLALHDVGREDEVDYVVFELLEGPTLRRRLEGGPLPSREATTLAAQVCEGLAAAHGRGIVHRDIKPENLGFTREGRVKILDFGLAGLTELASPEEAPEKGATTKTGEPLGSSGYMSPEQARGKAADTRSDIFSLGAVLYEMLLGRPAFDGATPADRIAAILERAPEGLGEQDGTLPLPLRRIVGRCLEKQPEARFQSARDLGFALEALSGAPPPARPEPVTRGTWIRRILAVVLLAATAGALWLGLRERPLPAFKQLTFRRGMIVDARFTPDGSSVVYSALFDGAPIETHLLRLDSPESRKLDLPPAQVLGVSPQGELALRLGRPEERRYFWQGTLARVPLLGTGVREIAEDVLWADWSPDGQMAVVRIVDGSLQLEFPAGRVLQRLAEWSWAGAEASGHAIFVEMLPAVRVPAGHAATFHLERADPDGNRHVAVIRLCPENIRYAQQARGTRPDAKALLQGLPELERYAEVLAHELAHARYLLDSPARLARLEAANRATEEYRASPVRDLEHLSPELRERLQERDRLLADVEAQAEAVESQVFADLRATVVRARREKISK